MKHIKSFFKVFAIVALVSITSTSCEDFMTSDTNRYMPADENLINSANDTVYSVVGILQKVQKLADRYVIFGELRADLLSTSAEANLELQDLNNFTVDPSTNPLCVPTDYYAVINNCNYFIKNANVNLVVNGQRPFLKEVAVVKAIRAWTYMQIAFNYGTVRYTDSPVLTLEQAMKDLPELNQQQLIDTLLPQIAALDPNVQDKFPFFAQGKEFVFIHPLNLLGDLYLWRASFTHSVRDYESAALNYSYLIKKKSYAIKGGKSITWSNDLFKTYSDNWSGMFGSPNADEMISIIQMSTTATLGTVTQLKTFAYDRKIVPSQAMTELYASQNYCWKDPQSMPPAIVVKYKMGDLRAEASSLKRIITESEDLVEVSYINKYRGNFIILCRVADLYLKYAEAVNRAGKPNLAFAVLKYGLNPINLANPKYIPAAEIADNKEYVNVFKGDFAIGSIGIHNRGAGSTASDGGSTYNVDFVIPDNSILASRQDTIDYVENMICNEMALETAYEGSRFQSLMRISNHRNDPSFLAKKVANKHVSDYDRIYNLLLDKKNWYVPLKK